ncbi:VOC family protein [Streptomyces sp. MB09-02B]|uniref:VOC family protein n=1 Tax=Streptomyces sp. MB09-02B TaxID=3028667 RepID=UPI0029B12E03|nr:VOC family protein [Streptomyces sp. MB09-02B]MDX3643954.1 VOC family protein [Streptomyces sp. MB09-02B]
MDLKTRDLPGTTAFFAATLGWHLTVDEEDPRRSTRITTGDGHRVGGASDLANPVYPPGTPAHIAFYLAVDDVDARTATAVANGARLVLPPFDAGDQGRVATLVDPVGAAVSLWQPYRFGGWGFPQGAPGTPHRMVLTCQRPDRAREFYRKVTGTAPVHADFASGDAPSQWEVVVAVADLETVAARALGQVAWSADRGRPALRLTSPEGLTLRVVQLRHGLGDR